MPEKCDFVGEITLAVRGCSLSDRRNRRGKTSGAGR